MTLVAPDPLTRRCLSQRRKALGDALDGKPALIFAGLPRPRNYAAAAYPFRASSHFVYLAGLSIPGAAILLHGDRATLFAPPHDPDHALWHGDEPDPDEIAAWIGCHHAPLGALPAALAALAPMTLPTPDLAGCAAASRLLGRSIAPGRLDDRDRPLALAMICARLIHDEAAVAHLRLAADAAARAFSAGLAATRPDRPERDVRAAMIGALLAEGLEPSFSPIVSVHGEVLHNPSSRGVMRSGDLLLVDFGAESEGGWASDVTRTWPVSGRYSPTQRAIVEVVLAAQAAAIDALAPGARYLDVHLTACRALAAGLVDLGILRGDVDGIVEDGLHALFLPHGLGHLLGLDVHDMEDLGDLAGYAQGRARSAQFGLGYLRLDRDLTPGMALTIEPGFYQVPALLAPDSPLAMRAGDRLDRARLADFADVRGVRIEDDLLITPDGGEPLTRAIPKQINEIEHLMAGDLQPQEAP